MPGDQGVPLLKAHPATYAAPLKEERELEEADGGYVNSVAPALCPSEDALAGGTHALEVPGGEEDKSVSIGDVSHVSGDAGVAAARGVRGPQGPEARALLDAGSRQ